MPIVNYVREHIRFIEYATDENVTASERLLWYALMHIMNQRAQGKVWPDDLIRVSNDRLLTYCPMKFDTMVAARNKLVQRGLIEYSKGDRNKQSPAYRVIYFEPIFVDGESGYTEKSDNLGGNIGSNIGSNMGSNMGSREGANRGNIYINLNRTYTFENDKEDEDDERRYLMAREETANAWKANFGSAVPSGIAEALASRAAALGFGPGVAQKAIALSCLRGTGSPAEYVQKLFSDWAKSGVRTLADADEYVFLHDASNGKSPEVLSATEAVSELHRFREERIG